MYQALLSNGKHYQIIMASPCPSALVPALARGVCDAQNATRHGLIGDNLLPPFSLVGLQLAMMIDDTTSVVQF